LFEPCNSIDPKHSVNPVLNTDPDNFSLNGYSSIIVYR